MPSSLQIDKNPSRDDRPDLLATIAEIAATIEIKSLFRIDRDGEPIVFLDPEVEERFQQLPREIQARYLCLQLRKYLVATYFQGSDRTDDLDNFETEEELENRSGVATKSSLFQSLDLANCGSGFFDRDWSILGVEDNGLWAVTKNNLTLHIKPDLHLSPEEREAETGDRVAVLMPHHLVERGAYIAIGNAGNPDIKEAQLVNIYLNISAEGAIAFLGSLTQELNNLLVPFSCRFLYDIDRYDRYDTGILTLKQSDYIITVESVLQEIYQLHQAHFREGTPLFTKYLARGVAIAELPRQTSDLPVNFADDRFQIIVDGLLAAWQEDKNIPQLRLASILDRFASRSIDLAYAYLEPHSEDIYL